MRSASVGRRWLSAAVAAALTTGAGCGLFETEVTVSLAISHHGTRGMDGQLPNYGEPDAARIFVNDKMWEVSLAEAIIVTTSAQIEACDGATFDFKLPYGPLPEYQLWQDKDLIDFGSIDLPEGTYCKLRIEYGRYQAAAAASAPDTPYKVEGHADVEGMTVYLAGTAENVDPNGDGKVVNWGLKTNGTAIAELDLSKIDGGGPFAIRGDEPGGRALTVAKTYDAFFKGLDFAAFDQAAADAGLLGVLTAETYVIAGVQVY